MITTLIHAILNTIWTALMAYQTLFWIQAFNDLKKHGAITPRPSLLLGWVLTGVFGAIALSLWTVLLIEVVV